MRITTGVSAVVLSASLLFPGCGSDSSMTDPDEPSGGLAAGKARVRIGSVEWTATATSCVDFGSSLAFVGTADSDPSVSMVLDAFAADPPANSAQVRVDANEDWRAGDSFQILGATIPVVTAQNGYGTGTAAFVNILDTIGLGGGTYATESGDYEFNCG